MSDLSNNLQIDTPENVLLDAEIAGFGTRCIAALVDYIIIFALLLIFNYLFSPLFRDSQRSSSLTVAIFVLLQFALITFYHLFFEFLWNGQTPGKRLLGLRVTQANGMPLTATGAIIRNLLRLFDFFPLFYAVGMISLFATRHTQRLGDLAARTIVIRERKNVTLENLKEDFTVQYRYISRDAPLPHYIQIDTLNGNDRQEVVSYLRRRQELRNADHVAGLLAQRIAARMNLNGDLDSLRVGPNAEIFLEQVARAFEIAEHGA